MKMVVDLAIAEADSKPKRHLVGADCLRSVHSAVNIGIYCLRCVHSAVNIGIYCLRCVHSAVNIVNLGWFTVQIVFAAFTVL